MRTVQKVFTITDDMTGKMLTEDEAVNVRLTVDRKLYVVDVHRDNEFVKKAMKVGEKKAVPGRPPRT